MLFAICNNGPLAKPPVPITTSGLNALIILRAFVKLFANFNGNIMFCSVSFRCNPAIQSPSIL